jgi:DNA-binding response OmpR family regulator
MKKILIVEDDLLVANIYRNKFAGEGFRVETASDGQAGLDSLRLFQPDAMILDLMLPKISGVDLMKKVRSDASFRQLPIFVFSNTYLTSMIQEAWKAGATKCLSKASCSPKQLIDIVRTALAVPANGADAQSAASGPQTTATTETSNPESDAQFQAELRKSFIDGLPAMLTSLRALLQEIIKNDNEKNRLKDIAEMYRLIRSLTSSSGLTGMMYIAQVADASEALLKELQEKPANINVSTLRTVALAIDFLAVLFYNPDVVEKQNLPPVNVLVVDDEAISRRAMVYALERARLKCLSVDDPQTGYNLLAQNRFDLVFLDVDMPGMSGFELCAKLRELPMHKKTPVIFVTGLNAFENRARSMMSGGNDLIGKPFLFIELAVKALVFMLRERLALVQGYGILADAV